MTEGATATDGALTRRTVAAAALWSVPVASSITSGAPAGYVDGSMVLNASHSAASNRSFQTYAAGSQQAVGTQGARRAQGSGFSVPSGTTSSVLVLNQGTCNNTRASQTLTFSCSGEEVPTSVSMNIYDITAVTTNSTSRTQYTDRVAISGGTGSTGTLVGPAITTSGSTLTGTAPSGNGGGYVSVTFTDLSSNTLSLTYSNPGTVTTGGRGTALQHAVHRHRRRQGLLLSL